MTRRAIGAALIATFAMLVTGCGRSTDRQVDRNPAPLHADPWLLVETNPRAKTPALITNGLVGLRLDRAGSGWGEGGDALPTYLCDEYETAGEEKIRPLPNLLGWTALVDGKPLVPWGGKEYRQTLDLQSGVLESAWQDGRGAVQSRVALHPGQRLASLQVRISGYSGSKVRLEWRVAGAGFAQRQIRPFPAPILLSSTGTTAWARTSVSGLAEVRQSETEGGLAWEGRMADSGGASLAVLVGWSGGSIGRSPGFREAPAGAQEAHRLASRTVEERCAEVEEASKRRISAPGEPDIEIDGPVEDQLAVRSFLYYLRSANHAGGIARVSPLNLSGQTYNGHVFWDADLWVFPALALLDPQAAVGIPEYRWWTRGAWARNFELARASRQAVRWGDDPPTPLYQAALRGGAKFGMAPWESSVTGLEVAPGDSRKQHHITGTAAYAASMASDLGLMDPSRAGQMVENAARFYAARAHLRDDGTYGIEGVMSPDEFHIGDNDLNTNLIAQWCLDRSSFGKKLKPRFHLPQDKESFLTYDGDALRTYKQAAAVLAIFPLQYPPAESQAAKMMGRFAAKVTKNGPAMSDSVHATIWARLGEREKAYEVWRKSWRDFTNHPLMLFSEKRSKDVTYFSTGAAGCLQTVLYGFVGIRLDDSKDPRASWSVPLRNGRWLNVVPNLPRSWNSVNLKNITVLGKRYDLMVTHDSVRATEGDS